MSTLVIAGGRAAARSDNHTLPRRVALRMLPRVLVRRLVRAHAEGVTAIVELRVLASRGGEEVRFALEIAERHAGRHGADHQRRQIVDGTAGDRAP